MQGSGLETLIGAAFWGVSSIMGYGEPWVHALRAYRIFFHSAILPADWLQDVGGDM